MPGQCGNRTYDLWNTSPMLCQLSYAVRLVRASDISEQNLVPSNQCNLVNMIFFCVGVVYSGEYDVCDVTLSVYPHRASLKSMPGHGGNMGVWASSCLGGAQYSLPEQANLTLIFFPKIVGERGGGGGGHQKNFPDIPTNNKIFPT